MKNVKKNALVVSTIPAFLISGAVAQAQNIPQIEFNPAMLDSLPEVSSNQSKPRVSAELMELQEFYLNLTPEQQDEADSNADMPVVSGMVSIEAVSADSTDALMDALTSMGLEGGASVGKMISGRLPIGVISQVENLPGLVFMRLSASITRAGVVENQADVAMRSDIARATNAVDGSGVTIGIISDSYNQLFGEAADIAAGELPSAGVTILDDSAETGGSDEGRAIAQLIHDIAPGADLLFHTGFIGAPDFAEGILELAEAGADVIIDDVGNLGQPMFQDGIIAQAVDTVVSDGVVYYSAAGNSADNSYDAPYEDSGSDLTDTGLISLHTFTPGDPSDTIQEFLLPANGSLFMSVQWDQPFASSGGTGASSDVDVFLVDEDVNLLAAGNFDNIGGDAVEILSYTNITGNPQVVGLVIGVFAGPLPGRIKWIDLAGEFQEVTPAANAPTAFGHPNAEGAIAVGAALYTETPQFGQEPPLLEPFSSIGGIDILFDTAGNAITPIVRNKPELVAPDGTDTSFFGGNDFDNTGFPNFFGTSAAAPHAAAVAALQLECDIAQTPGQILARQASTAIDMESPGFDFLSGAGLIDAVGALGLSCTPVAVEQCNGLAVTVNLGTGIGNPSSGDDVILGTPGDDVIESFEGNDSICALAGNDTIRSGSGNDFVEAGAGSDKVFGGEGDDFILGGDDVDGLVGGPGNDVLVGGAGDDILFGNAGDDRLFGEDGVDSFSGGSGNDYIETGPGATVGTGVILDGGAGDDEILGGPDADEIRGGAGNDVISGLDGNDQLLGGDGNDLIVGGDGDDLIRGNAGNDKLNGDAGRDLVSGGGGNDILAGGEGATDTCDGRGGIDIASADCEVVVNIP